MSFVVVSSCESSVGVQEGSVELTLGLVVSVVGVEGGGQIVVEVFVCVIV
jgi:hypothetical protein